MYILSIHCKRIHDKIVPGWSDLVQPVYDQVAAGTCACAWVAFEAGWTAVGQIRATYSLKYKNKWYSLIKLNKL